MLTNKDRRAILEQVKASDSPDIIAALRGQVSTEPMQTSSPTQEPINIPQSPQPVDVDLETTPALPSNLVDSTASLPTQLAKEGGVKKSHGGLHTTEPSSTYVSQNFNIPTIETPLTKLEQIQQMVANSNTSGGTISNYYDKFTGNNPNLQFISGASNQMYANQEQKQSSQDYGNTFLGLAAPIPLINSMKLTSAGTKIPGLLDDVILGPAGKLMSAASKTPAGTAVKRKVADISSFTKGVLEDIMPGTKNFSNVQIVNNTSKEAAQNLIKTKKGQKQFFKEFEDGAKSFDKLRNKYTDNWATAEGQKRLINQETEYLTSINYGNGNKAIIKKQAIKNAEARNLELILATNKSSNIAAGKIDANKVAASNSSYNNAYFQAGTLNVDDVLFKNNKTFPTYKPIRVGGEVQNTTIKIGNKYVGKSADRVVAHEIGHLTQGGRQLPVDQRLIKKLKPAANLSPENKSAYEYFKKTGKEPTAYMHGLRQQMKTDGLIRNYYDNISPDLLERAKTIYKIRPSGVLSPMQDSYSSGTRILDFMDGTKKNFNLLANEMNKLPAATPFYLAGTGTAAAASSSEKKLGGFDNDEEEENTINYRQHMMNYLHTSGRDTNMVNLVMDAIGQHESLNVADQKQISKRDDGTTYDGPGRGAYQFEMSDKGAASTALNRNYRFNLFNTDKELKDFPELNEFAKEKNPDFSTLSRADQDGLFIGDKIFGGPPRRNMFDLVTRNRTTPPNQEEVFQYWLRNHKGKISAIRNGKETTVPINEATKKEIAVERKKWNRSTKKLFKTGGYKSRYV